MTEPYSDDLAKEIHIRFFDRGGKSIHFTPPKEDQPEYEFASYRWEDRVRGTGATPEEAFERFLAEWCGEKANG